VHTYPKMRAPAAKLHKTISKIVHLGGPSFKGEEGREALYRANGQMRASTHCRYLYADACNQCAAKAICDGFHGDYAALFGTDEARPIKDVPKVTDPKFFIKDQKKVVEPEDYDWAL
jgi:hypothetical protein